MSAKYIEKINKLLRKAESTTPAEAEALFEKAQELMTSYAITEAMLAEARGDDVREEIVRKEIEYTGIYQRALFDLGFVVGNNNQCRSLIHNRNYTKPKATIQTVIGFESDVNRVEMLTTSLQIQALAAMQSWWKERRKDHTVEWMSGMEKFKERREFIEGFKNGISRRLREARERTINNFDESINTGTTTHVVDDNKDEDISQPITPGMTATLALRSRKEQVDDWVDEKYGRLRKSRGGSRSYGSYTASSAGSAAARTADIGLTRIGGQRKALG